MPGPQSPQFPNAASPEQWIAILGRRDEPTDGVEDYCTFLGRALAPRGVALQVRRVEWDKRGWRGALRRLWHDSANWRGKRVILQYTAMAWSRRGFPLGALAALALLHRRGVRCAVMFHDPFRQGEGSRWIDRLRGAFQEHVICRLYAGADKAIFAMPLGMVAWLPKEQNKASFIPIGANIPECSPQGRPWVENSTQRTVAVFCLDGMPALRRELDDISNAARVAVSEGARFRVLFVGRGTAEATDEITRVFRGTAVEVSILGLLDAGEISEALAQSDAMLCVRGRVNPCRGSAIAGIACGLPIVAYAGEAEGTPLADAGLVLAPYRNANALGAALARVLKDQSLLLELQTRSLRAREKCFSWDRIAVSYFALLEAKRS